MGKLLTGKKQQSFFETIFIGAIFASFLALIINFFLALSPKVNLIALILIFVFFNYQKLKLELHEIKILSFIAFLAFSITIYDTVNRPDAYLYHLPYINILNEKKVIIGLSNLHFRYAHVSLIQYLSAFNYTSIFNQNSIIAPLAILWSISIIYFSHDIYKLIKKKEEFSVGKIFSVLILIYIVYKINRYSEFGNDAISHLAFFILVSKFLYYRADNKFDLYFINLLCAFCISNKIFLGLSVIIPLYIVLKEKLELLKILKSLPSLILLFWFIKNVLVSGCLIFPIKITCSENFLWTNINQIERESTSGEAWAKAWPQRSNKNISMENYNKNFNWIEAWNKIHSKKILKTLAPYALVMLALFIYFRGDKKIKKENSKIYVILFMSLIGCIIFFLKFPLYRYGYSYLIIFLSIIFLIFLRKINLEKFNFSIKVILIIIFLIISSKQIKRYFEYFKIRQPIPLIFKELEDNEYKKIMITGNFEYYLSDSMCMYYLAPCTSQNPFNINYKKIYSYSLLY